MELDFDKYCVVDGSPTTVLPAPRRRSKASSRKSNGKVKCGNELLSLKEEFNEIKFSRYRSASCKDVRSRKSTQEGHELLKRGSVYQSSKEVRLLRRTDNVVERKKIEFSRGGASTFSFGIIDSLCSLDEDSSSAEPSTSSSCTKQEELLLHSRNSKNNSLYPIPERTAPQNTSLSCKSEKQVANKQTRDLMSSSESAVAKMNDSNSCQERDAVVSLHKSLSAKLALPHSPAQSDSDGSKTSSPRSRLHPVLKMLDPFVKSRSQKSPLNCAKETGTEAIDGHVGVDCNKTVCRSLQNDISDKDHHVGNNPQTEKKQNLNSHHLSSPAHLHGLLKMERKHGMLFFEFSVKSPEDVYIAKTCKVDNPLSWAYTFHSLHHRRKSNASAWGFKENNKESSMLGQMLVSCYLCTELKGPGAFNDSMVTEFVLYDVANSRRSISSQDSSGCSPDLSKLPLVSDEILSWGDGDKNEISAKTKNRGQSKNSRDSGNYESSQPVAAVDLHPGLEIAAIIMKFPFEKRESLKFKSGDRQTDKPLLNLLDLCQVEQEHDRISNPGKLHVVIPAGNHSLPSTESRGPSPLLDRWRLGGGCDCGGWDMACPLNVCGNPNLQIAEGQPLIDSQHPAQLFIQGRKDNVATFTMRGIEEGKYAVDFHAQLSSLQAFSICVAILHAAEAASTTAGQEKSKQMLQSDSLRVFAEEEIKHLIDAISEEEKLRGSKMEDVLPSFVVNPPFSPIARV
ncbi:hypothetical protein C2S52_008250 [Perilla frutescens var. hirtella]|nr:hypothetical protein C2S52_008250 [Perilla frutescens var. hirtella]